MSTKSSLVLIIFLIFILFFRVFLFTRQRHKFQKGQRVKVEAVLTNQPRIFPKSQRFEIAGIEVVTVPFLKYHYGDRLRIVGSVSPLADEQGASTLNRGVLLFPEIEVVEKERGSFVLSKIFALRKRLVSLFESYLPTPAGPLLLGIFLGVKRTLPQDFYEALRKTGVLHVVVASGMNVAMVISLFLALFNLICKRRQAFLLTVFAVVFYSALSGFDAPIVRATIMGTVALLGQFFGRLIFGALNLFLAGYLMVFIKPSLIFDLGFQLSFFSTAGLIFIRPLLPVKEKTHFKILKEDLVTTISTQTASLPILLANFGEYQVLSLLVNTLVLWTTPLLMAFGAGAAVLGLIFAPLGQFIAFLALPFLVYFEKIVTVFSRIAFAEVSIGKIPLSIVLGYYLLLTSSLLFWYKKKGTKFYFHDRGTNFEAKAAILKKGNARKM